MKLSDHQKNNLGGLCLILLFGFGLLGVKIVTTPTFADQPERIDKSVFADLIGHPVGITNDLHGHTILNTLDDKNVPLGHKVVSTGEDYIVLEDTTGMVRTTIPVYSIKMITRTKLPTKVVVNE